MPDTDDKIEVRNAVSPHHVQRLDRKKYMAVYEALMKILPSEAPGLTVAEAKAALLPHLSEQMFPGGEKAGWWLKAVQLDLEAKNVIARAKGSPVRLHKL